MKEQLSNLMTPWFEDPPPPDPPQTDDDTKGDRTGKVEVPPKN